MDLEALGNGIRKRRLAMNLSQPDVERLAFRDLGEKISNSYISRLEKVQHKRPGADVLDVLAKVLQVRDWRDFEAIGSGRLAADTRFIVNREEDGDATRLRALLDQREADHAAIQQAMQEHIDELSERLRLQDHLLSRYEGTPGATPAQRRRREG